MDVDLRLLDPIELFQLCAADRDNSDAWREFLRRYTTKVMFFIQGTLNQVLGFSCDSTTPDGVQESDLFQNVIVRLVESDCAAMKRFSGESEDDLLAYLAVICRSSVLDTLRRNNALKRRHKTAEWDESALASSSHRRHADHSDFERDFLAGELVSLTRYAMQCDPNHVFGRDQLVFKLHFFDGLSYSQIARCKGINLSKAGVEKLLKRLVGRVQLLASSGKSEGTQQ